jgi:hypothetical protein
MKVNYRVWEADQGLADIQAKIYTEVSGLPATAEQIRERNIRRNPNYTRYVLTEKGEPLAYVTARDSGSEPVRTYIGYPWALDNCPIDAQEKIFNDLFEYVKNREETKSIGSTVVVTSEMAPTQMKYLGKKGFVEEERIYFFSKDFDVKETSAWSMDKTKDELVGRVATIEDLDLLIDVCKADPVISRSFPDDAALKDYLENRVLRDGHAVMVLSGDLVVAASALLKKEPDGLYLTGNEDRILMRYSAIRPGFDSAWKKLLIEISKEAIEAGWRDIPLRATFHFSTNSPVAKGLALVTNELNTFEIILVYKEE